jgi:hypothetical protein
VLRHHHGLGQKQSRGRQGRQGGLGHPAPVRGVQKHQAKALAPAGQPLQGRGHRQGQNPAALQEPEGLQVAPQARQGRGLVFHEDRLFRPPAQGLDPQGAGAGKQVQNLGLRHRRSQNIEDRLPDLGGGGPGPALHRGQDPPPQGAGDDSHCCSFEGASFQLSAVSYFRK